MGHIPNWSASSTAEKYGWGIVQVAKWCHYRKGEQCTSPFPKGELCTIENCVMRPQDYADMFPEDFLALANERDALTARCEALVQQAAVLGDEVLQLRLMVACDEDCEDLTVEQYGYTHQCKAREGKTLIVNSFGDPLRCPGCPLWDEEASA